MNCLSHLEPVYSDYVEVDPTGRYGRYNEILGKGASKIVYRAFDEDEGIEVAWNQVKLYDFLQSSEDLERLYCEIHLLKTLKHKNIMKSYTSWVDVANRNINFVTELFTSGTLRQYRLKHKRVNIRAVKHWCRQILKGLLYLHSHEPPVIHRDLKCDNIFINGNQGEVKIGDLGLAAILRKSHAAHCVGTPEFMAPEVYEEMYNELVDIYSFGMCILEMVTFEYPYSECTHPAQIYKKVISGKKPDALYKVKDPEVRQFVEKCLATVSLRLSAKELLNDPFLQIDDAEPELEAVDYQKETNVMVPLVRQPYLDSNHNSDSYHNGYLNGYGYEAPNEWEYHAVDFESSGIELFEHHEDDDDAHPTNVDISIKGKRRDDGGIFLRLRIADNEGRIRNIYFPFDIETDTALSVATEMVAELDITDQDVTKIADMIDNEMASLVPDWRPGPGIEETTPRFANQTLCFNCASARTSTGSLLDYLSNNPCCRPGCASMHGRFEEITFQPVESAHNVTEDELNILGQSDCLHYQEIWAQHESRELTPAGSGRSHSSDEYEPFDQSVPSNAETVANNEDIIQSCSRKPTRQFTSSGSFSGLPSLYGDISDGYENRIQQKLRWLRAKYQIELRKLRDQQIECISKSSASSDIKSNKRDDILSPSSLLNSLEEASGADLLESFTCCKRFGPSFHSHVNRSRPNSDTLRVPGCEAVNESSRAEKMASTNNFSSKSLLPKPLHRTTSLPVDAIDV